MGFQRDTEEFIQASPNLQHISSGSLSLSLSLSVGSPWLRLKGNQQEPGAVFWFRCPALDTNNGGAGSIASTPDPKNLPQTVAWKLPPLWNTW